LHWDSQVHVVFSEALMLKH